MVKWLRGQMQNCYAWLAFSHGITRPSDMHPQYFWMALYIHYDYHYWATRYRYSKDLNSSALICIDITGIDYIRQVPHKRARLGKRLWLLLPAVDGCFMIRTSSKVVMYVHTVSSEFSNYRVQNLDTKQHYKSSVGSCDIMFRPPTQRRQAPPKKSQLSSWWRLRSKIGIIRVTARVQNTDNLHNHSPHKRAEQGMVSKGTPIHVLAARYGLRLTSGRSDTDVSSSASSVTPTSLTLWLLAALLLKVFKRRTYGMSLDWSSWAHCRYYGISH